MAEKVTGRPVGDQDRGFAIGWEPEVKNATNPGFVKAYEGAPANAEARSRRTRRMERTIVHMTISGCRRWPNETAASTAVSMNGNSIACWGARFEREVFACRNAVSTSQVWSHSNFANKLYNYLIGSAEMPPTGVQASTGVQFGV
jgi:hypothetical protein